MTPKNLQRFTPNEDAVIRREYPAHGAKWVALSGLIRDIWSPLSVRYRAAKLGVTTSRKIMRNDHMRDLAGFRMRCEVTEDECWRYIGSYGKANRPSVYLPQHPQAKGQPGIYTPQRAAWLLAGKKIPAGHCVYRALPDCESTCCNPDHLRSGSRGQMMRVAMRRPNVVVSQVRREQYEWIGLDKCHPAELVRYAAVLINSGKHLSEVRAETGISETCLRVIAKGQHRHQPRPGSSVFAVGAA